MKKFTTYITEAKISQANLDRAANIFKKKAEKRLGTKLYRFGGEHGYTDIKNGIGILYFYQKHKALRLNYINGEIGTVTLWKNYRIGDHGNFTIDLGGLGVLEAGRHLLDAIVDPKVGSKEVYPEIFESLNEAKRIPIVDFVNLIARNLPHNETIERVSWATITAVASENDVNIPYQVRENAKIPGTKGANAYFNVGSLASGPEAEELPKKTEMQYYVKITAQDPVTSKFVSVKEDKYAAQMLTKMTSAINNPDVKKEMRDPDSLFGIMKNLVQLVCRGSRNSLVIYGGPGIGKSYVVDETLRAEGLRKNQDFFIIKGKITTASLYQTLFMHRKGSLLMFDDADSVWGDQDAANLLKAALDSYDVRTISWISGRTVNVGKMNDEAREEFNAALDAKIDADPDDRSIKFPSSFDFQGRVIFISNLTKDKFDEAILNRSAKIDMTLTDEQIFHRMESIIDKLGDPQVPSEIKHEILGFLKIENAKGTLSGASMRTFVAAEQVYKSGLENWRELMSFT